MSTARDNPLTTAAAVGGAVAAGVFLWSRRNQISDWREGSSSESEFGTDDSNSGESFMASSSSRGRGRRRSQAEISEEALTLKETGKSA